jgi:hypothetical protein
VWPTTTKTSPYEQGQKCTSLATEQNNVSLLLDLLQSTAFSIIDRQREGQNVHTGSENEDAVLLLSIQTAQYLCHHGQQQLRCTRAYCGDIFLLD